MSGVGTDAEYMLEKALEEMDDIFRDSEDKTDLPQQNSSTPVRPTASTLKLSKRNENSRNLVKLLDEIEFILSGQVSNSTETFKPEEKDAILNYCKTLSFVTLFFKELYKEPKKDSSVILDSTGASSLRCHFELNNNTYNNNNNNNNNTNIEDHNDANKLQERLTLTEAELDRTKKNLTNYARKNEELLVRITEQRLADEKMRKANHSKLLLVDEEDDEMDRLKNHIDNLLGEQEKRKVVTEENSLAGLKTRLREKASECNRLKIQLEDMRQVQEAKDNTMGKIQEQIQRLFEENESLRQQLASATAIRPNGTHAHPINGINGISNGLVTPSTPGSVSSSDTPKLKSKDIMQMKNGLKSASEPNLMRTEGNRTIGLVSPPSLSVNGDETIYRPYRRIISDQPFANWSSDQVQDWMRDEGLDEYVSACAKCVKSGDDLLKYTSSDYEKNLGISDPIIRKKLNLALKAATSNSPDYAGRLDHNWVARWLDDLGMPQYKQNFYMHKVDGRVLLNMSLDDVLQLKVYNLLHHASFKRAIQFLRHQKFHPQFLREVANQSEERCDHVMLWTSQRIMHWLRSVDLAEYAPNLRGSGVNGALMVLEPRFNADTLANLLSIPANKTLLRRHVDTQFMTLLGDACQRQKELMAKSSDFVPLNGSEKHKLRKKGLTFGTLRRRKSETDMEAFICPMELDVSNIYSPPPALDPDIIFDLSASTSLSPSITNDNNSESTNDTSTVPRIAELSQEIEQMTSLLGSDTS